MNRVLIAAADEATAESIQASLSSSGFQTALVWSASQLVDFCRQHNPDFLVADLDLSGGSLSTALQAVRSVGTLANMPVIGVAKSEIDAPMDAINHGVSEILIRSEAASLLPVKLQSIMNESVQTQVEPSEAAAAAGEQPIDRLKTLTNEVIQIATSLRPQIPNFGADGPELFGYIEGSSSQISDKLTEIDGVKLQDKDIRHDFRNMIGSVTGFAELILMEPAIPADAQQGLARIRECSRDFVELLDAQKAEAGS